MCYIIVFEEERRHSNLELQLCVEIINHKYNILILNFFLRVISIFYHCSFTYVLMVSQSKRPSRHRKDLL